MKQLWIWIIALIGVAQAAPLPNTPQELLATAFCKKYQCYSLPSGRAPATELGVGTYVFLKKIKGTLFIRSREGKLTALGWNLPVGKSSPSQADLNKTLGANAGFIREFSQTFYGRSSAYNYANCLKPQNKLPRIQAGGMNLELECYVSSGEILFTSLVLH